MRQCRKCNQVKRVNEFCGRKNRWVCKICDHKYSVGWKYSHNREAVFERDGGCVECGMTREEHQDKYGRDITIHHKDGNGVNVEMGERNNDIDNLETRCLTCHMKLERRTKEWGTTSRAIIQYDMSGGEIGRWGSIRNASDELGIDKGNICRALKGEYKSTGGYKWEYA